MKLIALILAFVVTTLAVVPCCAFDGCADEVSTEQASNDNECSTPCSPFVKCSTCSGINLSTGNSYSFVSVIEVKNTYFPQDQDFISFYSPSIWQPPKIA